VENANKFMAQKRTTILPGHLRNGHEECMLWGHWPAGGLASLLIFVKRNSSSVCNIQSQFRHLASEEAS